MKKFSSAQTVLAGLLLMGWEQAATAAPLARAPLAALDAPSAQPGLQQPGPQPGKSAGGIRIHAGDSRNIQGTVTGVRVSTGEVGIRTGARSVRIHATPDEVDRLNVGDVVGLTARKYGDRLWAELADEQTRTRAMEKFSRWGTVSGVVSRVNKSEGVLKLSGGRRYRAHPQMLRGLIPGSQVTLTYVELSKDRRWVNRVDNGVTPEAGKS